MLTPEREKEIRDAYADFMGTVPELLAEIDQLREKLDWVWLILERINYQVERGNPIFPNSYLAKDCVEALAKIRGEK